MEGAYTRQPQGATSLLKKDRRPAKKARRGNQGGKAKTGLAGRGSNCRGARDRGGGARKNGGGREKLLAKGYESREDFTEKRRALLARGTTVGS